MNFLYVELLWMINLFCLTLYLHCCLCQKNINLIIEKVFADSRLTLVRNIPWTGTLTSARCRTQTQKRWVFWALRCRMSDIPRRSKLCITNTYLQRSNFSCQAITPHSRLFWLNLSDYRCLNYRYQQLSLWP